MKMHNFSAGPSILPQTVFEQAAQGVLDLDGSGLSVLEISHRSKSFIAVADRAVALVRELLKVPEGYHVLFLSGGASTQFFMAPLNCLPETGTAGYIDTGSWSSKAIKEARRYGKVEVVASSKGDSYRHIPKNFEVHEGLSYLHLTTNNTIFGTQYHNMPSCVVPLFADMSSDIFSREFAVEPFGLIYAGAQKNMGPAGVTLVIVREDMLGLSQRDLTPMLDYRTHIEHGSMYNTPPVFAIYVSMLVMQWVKENGGVAAMEVRNAQKAKLLYDEIDRNVLLDGVVEAEDRSSMNATFILKDPSRESEFLQLCKSAGCDGLKGHRSVGGFRASLYNAMELESVAALVEVMQAFEQKFG